MALEGAAIGLLAVAFLAFQVAIPTIALFGPEFMVGSTALVILAWANLVNAATGNLVHEAVIASLSDDGGTAVLDELRSMDWVPRLVRSKASKLNEAVKKLETAGYTAIATRTDVADQASVALGAERVREQMDALKDVIGTTGEVAARAVLARMNHT